MMMSSMLIIIRKYITLGDALNLGLPPNAYPNVHKERISWLFPNPVVNQTNVLFKIADKNDVRLIVTDVLGRIVYETNKKEMEAGNHFWTINTEGWINGAYIYSLQIGKQVEGGSFVVTKN